MYAVGITKVFAQARKENAEGQIREELVQRGFDEPTQVRLWSAETMLARKLKGFVFATKRFETTTAIRKFLGSHNNIRKPQLGPITLGYCSHFGLVFFSHPLHAVDTLNRS